MKVKHLIRLLKKQDPEAFVLASDCDGLYYDTLDISTGFIVEGKRVVGYKEEGTLCVLLEVGI